GVTGDQNDLDGVVTLTDPTNHLFAGHSGHEVVDEDEVRTLALSRLDAGRPVRGGDDPMAFRLQQLTRRQQDLGTIVDDENRVAAVIALLVLARHMGSRSGYRKCETAPLATDDRSTTVPPPRILDSAGEIRDVHGA